MMLGRIRNQLLYISFLTVASPISFFSPISYNRKITLFPVLAIIYAFALARLSWRFTISQRILIAFIAINTLYLGYSLIAFPAQSLGDSFLMKSYLTQVFPSLLYLVLPGFVNLKTVRFEKLVKSFSIGLIPITVILLIIAFFTSSTDLLESRHDFYKLAIESSSSVERDPNNNPSSLIFNLFYFYGGTPTMGPLVALSTSFLLPSIFVIKNKLVKGILLLFSVFLCIGVVSSASRSAAIGLLLGTSTALVAWCLKSMSIQAFLSRRFKFIYAIFSWAIVTAVFAVSLIFFLDIDFSLSSFYSGDFFASGRTELWAKSFHSFDFSLFGNGYLYLPYQAKILGGTDLPSDNLHNFYLTTLFETGLLGLLVYFLFLCSHLYLLIRLMNSRDISNLYPVTLGCFAAFVCSTFNLIMDTNILRFEATYSSVYWLLTSVPLLILGIQGFNAQK